MYRLASGDKFQAKWATANSPNFEQTHVEIRSSTKYENSILPCQNSAMFPLALIVHFKSFFAALHNFVKFNNACVLALKMAYRPTTCFASKGQSDIYETIVYKSKISHLTKTTTMSKSEVFKRK